jgi:glycosyltransferase involved in cell wall biosynthesis
MQPKVSIVIPVYNRPEQILRAAGSALAQTHRNLEVIVSDNASTDDTWTAVQRLVAEDSRVLAYRNPTNLGPTRNWIAALAHCSGEYIKVQWSDDWIEPTFVEELLQPMLDQPDVALAFSAALVHLADRDMPVHFFPQQHWFSTAEYLRRSLMGNMMPVSPACALVRRGAARFRLPIGDNPRLNQIAEQFGAGPDLLMLLEAAAASSRIAYLPKFLAHFRAGPTSFTCAHPKEVREGYRLTREFFVAEMDGHPAIRSIKTRLTVHRWQQTVKRALSRSD